MSDVHPQRERTETSVTADARRRPVLAATIVSSNEDLLIPCLTTLLEHQPDPSICDFRVYVSWNGPARGLKGLFPELVQRFPSVHMIESTTSGFPANQNILLGQITADYYLLLNDDMVFLPGSVDKALLYMERPETARVGMVTIRLLNRDGSLQPSTYSFAGMFRTILAVSGLRYLIPLSPKLFQFAGVLGLGKGKSQYWSHQETVEVDSCRGAYMMVRDQALRESGLWDVKGGEETEWHMRFHQHGWKIVFFHEAEVIHLGSMTVGRGTASELINLRSFLNIYYKHEAAWRYGVVRSAFFVTYVVKYIGAVLRGDKDRRDVAGRGVRMVTSWPREIA